jgi:hypothetical protein
MDPLSALKNGLQNAILGTPANLFDNPPGCLGLGVFQGFREG